MPQWLEKNLVGLIALGVAVLVAVGGFIAFFMTTLATKADVETMIDPLATETAVAALPTRVDFNTMNSTVGDLRETVAALGATVRELSATVDTQREAQREAIDALREIINTLSATVNTQGDTVAQANNMVLTLSDTVNRMDDAVGTLDGRLDSLTDIVSPLVPCIIELSRQPVRVTIRTIPLRANIVGGGDLVVASRGSFTLPESCEQARARAAQ